MIMVAREAAEEGIQGGNWFAGLGPAHTKPMCDLISVPFPFPSLPLFPPSHLSRAKSISHMLSQSKQMSGEDRKSAGHFKYEDVSQLQHNQPIEYSTVDYMPTNTLDLPPPPPPVHGSRESSYVHSENLESEPASDEETVKTKPKKSFTNLFQKKKNTDKKSDHKTRSRATSRASQASNDVETSLAQSAYAYYPPGVDLSRAKQPPPMKTAESMYHFFIAGCYYWLSV
jgi:hypothetical protein